MAAHICPWWVGYLLASPVRRLIQNPEQILQPYLQGGMTVVDLGCAMGFFSVPMARLVGEGGRVVCVDLQPRMLHALEKRLAKAAVPAQTELHQCTAEGLGLDRLSAAVDFVLGFAVVHEVPDAARLFAEIHTLLVPGGRLLIAEPRGHVSVKDFEKTLQAARNAGLMLVDRPQITRSRAGLLEKMAA